MNKLLRVLLLSSAILLAATSAFAVGPAYKLEVAGLACPFCAYGIEKRLNALDGVEKVETHIEEGTVVVTMKDGAALDEAKAREAVKGAGFTLDGFEPLIASPQP